MNYTYFLIAIVFNAVANILLKIAAIGNEGTSVRALIMNPYAVLGVVIFASNVYFYIQALRVLPISLVYPIMTAVGFTIINAYGIFVLKESVSAMVIVGYVTIILGVFFVTAYR
jgi:multidrug transporter EmrE-like cation transporter